MSTEAREVRLEVYVNGAFYSADSYWASDDKDVQMEFEITDAIYDFIGCDASQEIDVQLEVETNDHVSVSYCSPGEMKVQLEVDGSEDMSVCEVEDFQLEMDKNDSIPELKSFALVAEAQSDQSGLDAVKNNSRTEKTAGRMFRKMKAVFQRLSAVFQTKTLNAVEEPEVDPEQSCVPDSDAPQSEPKGVSVDVAIDQGGLDTEENISPTGEMPTEAREVCLEVYINGAFYSTDSYWASDDKDLQLEFEITDAIYDFIGCSASREIDVQLEVVTDDHVSVSYCSPGEMKVQPEVDGNENISVCEVEDLQLEMDKNDSIPELKSFALVAEAQSDQSGLDAVKNNSRTGKDMHMSYSCLYVWLVVVFQE
ncbi:hypothetical protein ROHU_021395 [Labeo rohita]|uniref:Uncharacterized protein n=1 Tax=Labeo rohita TaxID=84645 RepID=A0A498N9C3_LABRO|nr:hypothetical protein ROHU_021395 [Labeo rohita]